MTDSSPTHTSQYDETDTPSMAVVQTVCQARNGDVESLPPLHDAIDTDALNTICGWDSYRTEPTVVSFVYAGYSVTVISHGTVTVEPLSNE